MRIPLLFLVIFSLIVISGCRTVMVAPTPVQATVVVGHPPHAPADGYRYHYRGHDLVYDTNLGAYIVLGFDGVYFYNNIYLRFYDGDWQVVEHLNGPWHRAQYQQVPGKLRSHRNHNRRSRYDGPPPHAPAHGYRHHYRDVDMEYHRDLGAYVVLGFDDLFFLDGVYMRFFDGRWHTTDRYDGKWRIADDRRIPRQLRSANTREKQGLYNRTKQQYRNENQEEREYRKKYDQDRSRNDKRDNRSGGYNDRSRNSERNRNTDRNAERNMQKPGKKAKDSKGGLFSKVKKKAEDKEASKNSADEKRNKTDENNDDQDSDKREKRDNGNRF